MKFREIAIGQSFDFINDENRMLTSFYDRCRKISARRYRSESTLIVYTVGSIDAEVFHISPAAEDASTADYLTNEFFHKY